MAFNQVNTILAKYIDSFNFINCKYKHLYISNTLKLCLAIPDRSLYSVDWYKRELFAEISDVLAFYKIIRTRLNIIHIM